MADALVAVAIKPVASVLDVDWATGSVRLEPRHRLRTPADAAALGVGLEIAHALGARTWVVALGDAWCEDALRAARAEGASRAVRVAIEPDAISSAPHQQWGSEVVAAALATVLGDADVIVCGDASGDRGSGTVPAALAHLLGRPQALCLRTVAALGGDLVGTRRLDGGRRERLSIRPPCVVSVEPGAAAVPRAALRRVLDATAGDVEVLRVPAPPGARRGDPPGTLVGPYRPRASDVAPPAERDAVRRGIELAGTLSRSDPAEVLRSTPEVAAATILERLERWGMR